MNTNTIPRPAVRLLIFQIGAQNFGVELQCVERVTRAAAITPLPPNTPAPSYVAGVLNVGGRVLPVFDGHALLGAELERYENGEIKEEESLKHHAREVELSDEFLIVRLGDCNDTNARQAVLWVERVQSVWESADESWVALESVGQDDEHHDALARAERESLSSQSSPSILRGLVKREGELIWVCDLVALPPFFVTENETVKI